MNSASVQLANGSWLVAGGIDSTYWKMDAVEYTDGGRFERGNPLPVAVFDQCMVRLDDTRVFLAGGIRDLSTT